MSRISDYIPAKVTVRDTGITGLRIDRAHSKNTVVKPRIYEVRDANMPFKGAWYMQVMPKWVETKAKASKEREALVLSVFAVPTGVRRAMIGLTRRSIMVQGCSAGQYKGRPYCHLSFRPLNQHGGKKTLSKGQRDKLPPWITSLYGRRIRLRKTVQGKATSDKKEGKRLAKVHDRKQVIIFDRWDDVEFIRYFFALRVFSEFKGYALGDEEG